MRLDRVAHSERLRPQSLTRRDAKGIFGVSYHYILAHLRSRNADWVCPLIWSEAEERGSGRSCKQCLFIDEMRGSAELSFFRFPTPLPGLFCGSTYPLRCLAPLPRSTYEVLNLLANPCPLKRSEYFTQFHWLISLCFSPFRFNGRRRTSGKSWSGYVFLVMFKALPRPKLCDSPLFRDS